MSTIDPATTRRVGEQARSRGAEMIDSPVGKTADAAVAGTLTLFVEHFRARPSTTDRTPS